MPGKTIVAKNRIRTYGEDGFPDQDIDTGHDHSGAGDPHTHTWG